MAKRFAGLFASLVSVFLAGYLFLQVFRSLPIENTPLGLDWRTIWKGIHLGQVTFGNTEGGIGGMYTPPWGIFFLFPLGFLSFRDSWAIICFVSLALLIFSVPKNKGRLDPVGIILLAISFPTLRNFADGNLEGLVAGGVVLVLLGYRSSNSLMLALGVLLATIKIQETWLYCLFVLSLVLKNWPATRKLLVFTSIGSVVASSMVIWGHGWIRALFVNQGNQFELSSQMGRSTLIDISLSAALARLDAPIWFIVVIWTLFLGMTLYILVRSRNSQLSWESATLSISASMLLAPYVSGNSFLTIVVIGIIPMLRQLRFLGISFLIPINLPYLASTEALIHLQSYFWSLLLLLTWGIAGSRVFSQLSRNGPSLAGPPMTDS